MSEVEERLQDRAIQLAENSEEGKPIPVIVLPKKRGNEFCFRCPGCGSLHHHGALEGSRAAHCTDGPWREGEYILAKHLSSFYFRLLDQRGVKFTNARPTA